MKPLLMGLVFGLLAACVPSLSPDRIEGWPELQIREHYVPQRVLREKHPVGVWATLEGLAVVNLEQGTCDIYYSADAGPVPQWVKDHERAHCDGYEDEGSKRFTNLLRRHKAKKGTP